MAKPTLKSVKKQTNNKYVNMFELQYDHNGQEVVYNVASRREIDKNSANKHKLDAVIVLPYIIEGGEIFVVFSREFRYPINDYVYDVPAGCVDKGETGEQTAIRELKEEIGAEVLLIEKNTDTSFTSPGIINETSQSFFALVSLNKKTNLEPHEIITKKIVPLTEVLDFVDSHLMAVQGKMMAKIFYYKTMFEQLKNKKIWQNLSHMIQWKNDFRHKRDR